MQRPESTPTGLRSEAGSGFRRAAVFSGVLVLAFGLTAAPLSMATQPGQPRLTVAGVAEDPCQPQRALPVPAGQSGQFDPDSSILRTAAGAYVAPGLSPPSARDQSACAAVAEQADREWLRAGTVPGDTAAWRSMATRALLDLRRDVRSNGAVVAGWRSGWDYVWPRDSSWVAVALAQTGHPAMAYRILRFLQRMQPGNGIWAARYLPDGSGPVLDGRPAELDADGWVPWAVWSWAATQPLTPDGRPSRELAQLWPMVVRAADAAARSLTRDGLPGPAMDYWENSVQVTLGTAAPLLAGLRAAAALAADLGGAAATRDGHRWAAAAARLARAITAAFGRTGYQRQPLAGSGADAAITFLGPPFAAPGPQVLRAARSAQLTLSVPNGGLAPGQAWSGTPDVAWTAETAFFALFDASTGQHDRAAALLDWLAAHRTNLGSLPEQVNSAGQPASTAPLSWTDAVTLLALLAQTRHVPTVPLPPRGTLERGGAAAQVLSRAVAEIDGAAAEPVLLRQGQVHADLVRQGPGAAAHDGRDDEQLVLVHQPGRDSLGGEPRAADGEVAVGRFLQLSHLFRVEVPLDAGPGGVRRLERGGVHDLVRRLPDPREVEPDGRLAGERVRGLPVAHRLVHPPAVEIGADRPLQLVDERVHFLVRRRPLEAPGRVGDVAVE